jgi:hypothetical protein
MVNCTKMKNSASEWTLDDQNSIDFTVFQKKSDNFFLSHNSQFLYKRMLKFMSASDYANDTVPML